MKILFVYDTPKEHIWEDGLYAALELIEKRGDIVDKINLSHQTIEYKGGYDFVLGWGGFGSKVDEVMRGISAKKGLCIGGCATKPESALEYDVLFYETKWYRDQIDFHPNIVHAFGVNTNIFQIHNVPRLIDFISVGAFALWKRLDLIKNKPGSKMVIGYYQNNNEQESLGIVRDLVKNGVIVSNQMSPRRLVYWLNSANTAYIPANIIGGGERSVLEARACGLNVIVEDDNPKLKELLISPIYSHRYYADQLTKGIVSCLS